jgi:hypothetical protein
MGNSSLPAPEVSNHRFSRIHQRLQFSAPYLNHIAAPRLHRQSANDNQKVRKTSRIPLDTFFECAIVPLEKPNTKALSSAKRPGSRVERERKTRRSALSNRVQPEMKQNFPPAKNRSKPRQRSPRPPWFSPKSLSENADMASDS